MSTGEPQKEQPKLLPGLNVTDQEVSILIDALSAFEDLDTGYITSEIAALKERLRLAYVEWRQA